MPKKEPKNCWNFWKCGKKVREKCPAYTTDSGRECWMVATSFRLEGCPKAKNGLKNCLECPWFNKLNPDF